MSETDWAGQQEAVRLAIATALKLPDVATIGGKRQYKRVEWAGRDSADRWAQGGAVVELRLGAIVPVGQLENRPEYDSGSDKLLGNYGRYERFTVTVAIETDDQTPGATAAGALGGRLRTRIQRPDIRALFTAHGVAFIAQATTFEGDYEADGRMLSASYQDLLFSHVAFDKDEASTADGKYFDHVTGSGVAGHDLAQVDLDAGPPEG